jgi:hypothetical protein
METTTMSNYPKNESKATIVVDDAKVRIDGVCKCGREFRAHDLAIQYDGDRASVITAVCGGCHVDYLYIELPESKL